MILSDEGIIPETRRQIVMGLMDEAQSS